MVNASKPLMFSGKIVLFDEWEIFFDGSKKIRQEDMGQKT